MKLLLQGHDERYTVEQSLLNLFPGELPVYEPILPGDDSWAVVTLREEDDCCHVTTELRWQGRQTSHREVLPLSGRKRRSAPLGDADRCPARQARHSRSGRRQNPRGDTGMDGAVLLCLP